LPPRRSVQERIPKKGKKNRSRKRKNPCEKSDSLLAGREDMGAEKRGKTSFRKWSRGEGGREGSSWRTNVYCGGDHPGKEPRAKEKKTKKIPATGERETIWTPDRRTLRGGKGKNL